MATQIAPTPVVKGAAAVKIYKEVNQKRSQASKNGAEYYRDKTLSWDNDLQNY